VLPRIRYSDGIRRRGQESFRGINRNPFAGDGVILDSWNLSSRYYPAVSTRPKRWMIDLCDKFDTGYSGAYNHIYEDILFTVAFHTDITMPAKLYKTDLSAEDPRPEYITDLADSAYVENTFTVMNNYLVIFPSGTVYNLVTGKVRYIDEVYYAPGPLNGGPTIEFLDGTLYDIEAKANTVKTKGEAFPFNVGDCVVFKGSRYNDGVIAVVQEISEDGKSMMFYENTFTLGDTASESRDCTIERKKPEGLRYVMSVGNRLWACGGKRIAASADGDPFNWNTLEGTAADSWQVDALGEGDFTGCVNYGGTPIFFKENALFKVLGDYPGVYTLNETPCFGIMPGGGKSVAEVSGYLFWVSSAGVMYYSGGVVRSIGAELGKIDKAYAIGGSDGIRYYVCFRNGGSSSAELYCYDTTYGVWYKEDDLYVKSFTGNTVLWATDNYGSLYSVGDPPSRFIPECAVPEEDFVSSLIFTDYTFDTADRKYPHVVQMRFRIADGARVKLMIKYDSEGEFIDVPGGVIDGGEDGVKTSVSLPVSVRRCDHFTLKIEGVGEWQLSYIAIESSVGSGK